MFLGLESVRHILPRIRSGPTPPIGRGQRLEPLSRAPHRQGRFVPFDQAALMPAAAHRIGRGLLAGVSPTKVRKVPLKSS